MPSEALRTLEQLRQTAVDEATRALALARQRASRAEELVSDARTRLVVASAHVDRARQAGGELSAPRDYAWAEGERRALRSAQASCEARLHKAELVLREARTVVAAAEQAVREAELGRRAAARVITRREAERAHKLELRTEQEAEDNHRARR